METLNEIEVSVIVGYISTVLSVFINSITKTSLTISLVLEFIICPLSFKINNGGKDKNFSII